jgi:hypothetical protein
VEVKEDSCAEWASPSPLITSRRPRLRPWCSGSTPSRGGWTSWSTTSGGGEDLIEWNTPLWAHDLDAGLRMLHGAVDTHLITSHLMLEHFGVTEANWRDAAATQPHFAAISESPRFVGRAVAALAADPDVHRRTGGSYSSGGLAGEYGFTDVDGSRPDCWRYLLEVQEAGLPAEAGGYR